MIGDIFTHAMLITKKNGMPARAHNRFQFFYNTKRRVNKASLFPSSSLPALNVVSHNSLFQQRWLFSVSEFIEEDNISFNPSTIVQPAAWHRSSTHPFLLPPLLCGTSPD
jgi:hypothetical protein